MYSIVRPCNCSDQILRIQKQIASLQDILFGDRVHVVDQDFWPNIFTILPKSIDLMSFHSKVTSAIPYNHAVSQLFPLFALVKYLVQVTVKPKCVRSDFTIEPKVLIAFLKGRISA
jgi:hypothetical protein